MVAIIVRLTVHKLIKEASHVAPQIGDVFILRLPESWLVVSALVSNLQDLEEFMQALLDLEILHIRGFDDAAFV